MEQEFRFGKVKWFSTSGQSFGYIIGNDGVECYVHYSHISPVGQENPKYRVLAAGQIVKYTVVEGYLGKGTQADQVEIFNNY